MTDTAARLRALAERLNTTRVTHHQVSRDWEPYETATKTHPVEHIKAEAADAILALLDERDFLKRDVHILVQQRDIALSERDAAVALLTEAGMYVNPHTADDPRAMALWKRIDAILGGDKGA